MRTKWIWSAMMMASISGAGCMTTGQLRVMEACRNAPGSPGCVAAQEYRDDEKEGEAYDVFMEDDWRRELACESGGGIWRNGNFWAEGLGRYGSCLVRPPVPVAPEGMAYSFPFRLQEAARPSLWPVASFDTRVRGALCEVGAESDIMKALAVVGRAENLMDGDGPHVSVDYPTGTTVTYDARELAEGGWSLSVRGDGALPEAVWILERVQRVEGTDASMVLTIRGGEERAYTACQRSVYEPHVPWD